tara:strand:- start:308 stop:1414 length:1107 start_codon:yes stop_codon:yes gene_type:complete
MNRTYTYSELKDLINEELENFNHIIESKHIFNSEFNKYRKFFKGLLKKTTKTKNNYFWSDRPESETNKKFVYHYPTFNTYEDSKGYGLYFYLTKDDVVDLDMTQLYKDFPNLKKDQELLLSLKPNVRSGRRPKDLEKDYEAERLKKAAEENKATCGICNQHWELVDMEGERQKFGLSKNVIADHGFTIRFGGRNGVCFGARFHCWEKSPKVKIEYVKQVLKPLLNSVLKEQPTQVTVDAYKKRIKDYFVAKEEYNNLPNELIYEYRNKKREMGDSFNPTTTWNPKSYSENVKKVHAIYERCTRPAIAFSGQQVATLITLKVEEVTLEYLTKFWFDYKTRLENEIATFETAIKNWKLQPTPRERLKENQ